MDLKEKVLRSLHRSLEPEYVRLENDDGISGFVVSRKFDGMSAFDRQTRIDESLRNISLNSEERRQILMIAGLTPDEYRAVGPRIGVHKVREVAGGALEIVVHGGLSDAQYVRGALNNQKGVRTTEPKPVNGNRGALTSFRAEATKATPLTREAALRILLNDRYIELVPRTR